MIECKKVKYSSQEFAEKDIVRIKQISKRNRIPIRSYLCKCGSWHLTSKSDLTIDVLNAKIKSLTLQLEYHIKENFDLKKAPRTDNKEIEIDKRIIKLNKRLNEQGQLIKKLREDKEKLIIRIIKLQPENELHR